MESATTKKIIAELGNYTGTVVKHPKYDTYGIITKEYDNNTVEVMWEFGAFRDWQDHTLEELRSNVS